MVVTLPSHIWAERSPFGYSTNQAEVTSTIWSPCGAQGLLNINSQVRLTSTDSKANGVLTTDSIDTKFTQKIYYKWRKC
ncbi:hypothetical protein KVT40_005520 [Elsinoe batatas]|uniref:DUF4360 domain-containing protein n=1 Tax=Elsinoe batatas TaxID=2601811 RepID=A0A8K0L368_9PEZI|nr:hypothetical protein KVT40_005520 [Elsinoe batatas]